jgi:hypothetical protein
LNTWRRQIVDDDRLGAGLSPEKVEQLRQLISVLEGQVRIHQHQAGVDELAKEIARIREAVESRDRTTPFTEIFKSVRNIAEGIVGAAIYDLIPNDWKSSLRMELLGAHKDPRDVNDRSLYAVRVQIMAESVPAFQFAVDSSLPFAFTLSDLEMRIWCGPELASLLRIAFEKCGIEHPIGENFEIQLRVPTPGQAALVKAELQQVQVEVARAILESVSVPGLSPEKAASDALASSARRATALFNWHKNPASCSKP